MSGANAQAETAAGPLHQVGQHEFDVAARLLRHNGQRTPLSEAAAALLANLVIQPGRAADLEFLQAQAGLSRDQFSAASAELAQKLGDTFKLDHDSGQASLPLEFSLYSIIEELRSRKVFRVATGYAVTAWLILQVAEIVSPLAGLGEAFMRGLLVVIVLGFPVAVCAAWALELTPAGMIIDWRPGRPRTSSRLDEKKIDRFIIALLVLLVAILVMRVWQHESGAPAAIRVVAVLPFTHSGAAGGDSDLCAGFAEEIRVGLSRLPGIRVAARAVSTSASYAQATIAVDWLVEGSCQVVSDVVGVKVSLTEAKSGLQEWAYSSERSVNQLLNFQDHIAAALAFELSVPGEAIASSQRAQTLNPQAYRLYLQGRAYLSQPSKFDSLATAAKLFRDAISEDEEFAAAHAGLCEASLAQYLRSHDPTLQQDAESACLRASHLGPGLPEVYVALGRLFLETGDYGASEKALRKALEVRPDDAAAKVELANVLAAQNQPAQAETLYREALAVPAGSWSAHNNYGRFLVRRGQLAAAAEQFEKVVALTPDNASAHNNLGAVYLQLGRLTEATDRFARAAAIEPVASSVSNYGAVLYYTGEFAAAEAQFRNAAERSPDDYRLRGNIADALYQIDGKRDQATEEYKRASQLAEEHLEISRKDAQALAVLAFYRARLDDTEYAERLIARAIEHSPSDPEVLYFAALAQLQSGDVDKAASLLQQAIAAGLPRFLVESSPDLAPLRDHSFNQVK